MISVKGMAALRAKEALVPFQFDRRDPKAHDVVIDIHFCGICHSDIHMARAEWDKGSSFPMVPGHEIVGVVRAVGEAVTRYQVGDRVGVGCMVDSCRTCDHCQRSLEQYCVEGMVPTYGGFERDSLEPTQGGYSTAIVTHEDFVVKIPKNLPLDKAAPLLCAGITVYSPLKHWKVGKGSRVAVMGLGGLGHMAVKIARALGAEVTVLSHSAHKREDAEHLGAHHFVLTHPAGEALKQHALSFDFIINTISSSQINMDDYFGLLKLDGTMVSVGLPEDPLSIHPASLIRIRRNYAGTVIGSIQETQEMLDFCSQHNILPEVEMIRPEDVNEAYERMLKNDVRYRFVMEMRGFGVG